MRLFGWILTLILWTFLGALLHYSLPQRDIVYVQGTEIIRQDFSGWNRHFYAVQDSGNAATSGSLDLRLINTTQVNGRVMVYRNQDTGLWPPYLKFESSDLQAEAQGAISTKDDPRWYLLTHYGWRIKWLTVYPNAVSIKEWPSADTPKPLPWVNIGILALVAFVYFSIWSRWRRFRENRLDPAFEEIQDNLEGAGDAISDRGRRLRRWFTT